MAREQAPFIWVADPKMCGKVSEPYYVMSQEGCSGDLPGDEIDLTLSPAVGGNISRQIDFLFVLYNVFVFNELKKICLRKSDYGRNGKLWITCNN